MKTNKKIQKHFKLEHKMKQIKQITRMIKNEEDEANAETETMQK